MCHRNYETGYGINIRIYVSIDAVSVYRWLIKGLGCLYCNGDYDNTIKRELGLTTKGDNTTGDEAATQA